MSSPCDNCPHVQLIIPSLCFLISAALQVLLSRQHKREKRYGPSPSNNYTSGSGKKQPFWKRNRGANNTHDAAEMGALNTNGVNGATNGTSSANEKGPFWKRNKNTTRDAEFGAAGAGVGAGALIAEEKHRHDNHNRPSHDTGVTGTTAHSPVAAGTAYGGPNTKYNNEPTVPPVNHSHGHPHNNNAELAAPTGGYQPYREGAGTSHANAQVIHDPNPYTDIHHGGIPHPATPNEVPPEFGRGHYH